MTLLAPESITCPACGREQMFDLYRSINVTLDPGLKAELFDGDLTRFSCAGCGHVAQVSGVLEQRGELDRVARVGRQAVEPAPDLRGTMSRAGTPAVPSHTFIGRKADDDGPRGLTRADGAAEDRLDPGIVPALEA